MQANEMRDFAAKGIVKVVSFFLLMLSVGICAMSTMSAVLLADHNAYSIDGPGYLDGIVNTLLERDADSIWERLAGRHGWGENEGQRLVLQEELNKSFDTDQCNLRYAVFEVLEDGASNSLMFSPNAKSLNVQNARYYKEYETGHMIICLDLPEEMTVLDKYYFTYHFFGFLGRNRYLLLLVVTLSFVAVAILLTVLLFGVGRKPGSTACFLHPWDRIPLEIYLFCAGITLFVPSLLIVRIPDLLKAYAEDQLFKIAFDAMVYVYRAIVCYFVVMTIARRVKAKRLLKNTFLHRLIQFLNRMLFQVEWGLRFYVRFLVFFLLLTGAELVCLLLLDQTSLTILWAGRKILICLGAAVVTYNFGILDRDARKLMDGNVTMRIRTEKLLPIFRRHGETLNGIRKGMKRTLDEQMRSERMKAELITNVSHDLKTPLTSIVNYVDLIEKAGLDAPETPEYFEVVNRQAVRLKKLVLDLVEASKAASGSTKVEMETLDLNLMLSQAAGEYVERMRERGLEQVLELSAGALQIRADPKHLWRVFDNLLGNATLYSHSDSRVYITTHAEKENAVVIFRNISSQRLNISPEELMERFVRGDSSRNTEGSGLGLAIARDLTTLQGGDFQIIIDGDLFKAVMTFPLYHDVEE